VTRRVLKLSDMTMTNRFVSRLLVMCLSRLIIAAPEDRVGLNANLSENDNEGGDRKAE